MKKYILAALALTSKLAFASADCNEVKNQIDQIENLDGLKAYLKLGVEKQSTFDGLFLCLAGPQRLPTDILNGERDFIYGDGWGSARANSKLPLWNEFQSALGRSLWGGKIFQKSSDGVNLLNVMLDRKTMSYAASVYNAPSILDNEDSVVLDYRKDETVPVVSQLAIRRVRDELREITFKGEASKIYVGRAYLYTGPLHERFSDAWEKASSHVFAANFILDFRSERQEEVPSWALRFFE